MDIRKSVAGGVRILTGQEFDSGRAVDHFVFLVTCGFLLPPFAVALLVEGRGSEDANAFTIFAPFVSAVVLVVLLLLIERVEGRVAGARPRWPPALVAIPFATIAAGLAFSWVDPGHHWWRDGLAGAAWGTATAYWGWRRARPRPSK